MASFDFIDASAKGFEFVWRKLPYLMKVAIPVIFVKTLCVLAAYLLGFKEGMLAYGLVLLPGQAVEGIFLVCLIRYFVYQEPIYIWGKIVPPPESDRPVIPFFLDQTNRKKSMMAAIIIYVLAYVILYAMVGVLPNEAVQNPASDAERQVPLPVFLLATAFFLGSIYFSIWSVRLFFSYIPMALGFPFRFYLQRMAGIKSSLLIFLTMAICSVPFYVIFGILLNILSALFFPEGAAYVVFEAFFRNVLNVVVTSVQLVAITHGICHIMSDQKTDS